MGHWYFRILILVCPLKFGSKFCQCCLHKKKNRKMCVVNWKQIDFAIAFILPATAIFQYNFVGFSSQTIFFYIIVKWASDFTNLNGQDFTQPLHKTSHLEVILTAIPPTSGLQCFCVSSSGGCSPSSPQQNVVWDTNKYPFLGFLYCCCNSLAQNRTLCFLCIVLLSLSW